MLAPRQFRIVLAMISVLLLSAPMASAQQQPPASAPQLGTVTVTAEGSASAPADVAYLSIVLNTVGFYGDPMGQPIPSAPAMGEIDPAPVIDALVENGVVADDITVIQGQFTGEWSKDPIAIPVTLLVTLPNPTVDQINELLQVSRDAAATNDLLINSFNVMYGIEDCAPLRQDARRHAVENARTEANAQAEAMDAQLGSAVGSRDVMPTGPGSYQVSTCMPNMTAEIASSTYMMTPFDPNVPAEVRVTIGLEVVFELQQ